MTFLFLKNKKIKISRKIDFLSDFRSFFKGGKISKIDPDFFRNFIGGYLRAQTELDDKRGLYIMQEDHTFQLEQTRTVFDASEKSCDQGGKIFSISEF